MSPREKRHFLLENGWICGSIFGDAWFRRVDGVGIFSLHMAFELESRCQSDRALEKRSTTKV